MLKLTKNPNLTEQAYQSVKRQLLNGSFPEGSKLTEEYLSSELGISKSPVREALMRLESEGLINIEARRGAYVRKFSAKEVRDLYDLRALLEVHAVSVAEITPELLEQMEASIERTRNNLEAGDKLRHIDGERGVSEDSRQYSAEEPAVPDGDVLSLGDNRTGESPENLCGYAGRRPRGGAAGDARAYSVCP